MHNWSFQLVRDQRPGGAGYAVATPANNGRTFARPMPVPSEAKQLELELFCCMPISWYVRLAYVTAT